VPVLAGNAGGQSANTPSKYPFTVNWSLPAYVDAKAWIEYLKAKFPSGAKIAIMTATSDAVGQDYLNAVHQLMSGTNLKIVSSTQVAATAPGPPSIQVSQMKASGANVLMAIKEVANEGWRPDAFLLTSECSTLQLVTPAGKAADGVLCDLYINDPAAASASSDPALEKIIAAVKKYQPGVQLTGSTISGFSAIETMFKAAEQAQKSPLGLSRLGVLYAATHMTYQSATMEPGVTYSLNYPKDEVAMEATQMSRFDGSTGQFVKVKLYDFNGQTTGKASG
jgi:ABC-type branched-subunit amino acid transport system substrate-binding protein